MGCIVTKKPSKLNVDSDDVPALRRRLTLGSIDDGESADTALGDVTEDDRSLIEQLSQQQILDFTKDFIKEDGNASRRFSVGTETGDAGASSFSSKATKLHGEPCDFSKERVGFACKKGLKPEAPNQDSFLILKIEDRYALYGVFDGHGRKGHDVSNFVKDLMPKVLFSQEDFLEDPHEALLKSFAKVQGLLEKATALKTIDAARSGTTCSIVLHLIQQRLLYVAHVGDSRVVLGKKIKQAGGGEVWKAVDLTTDHKPELPEERERIEKNGGVVVFDGGWNYRVFAKGKRDARGKRYPGLNMSRAMGDLQGFHDAGISASPDIVKRLVGVQPGETHATPSDTGSTSAPSISSHDIDPETDKFILLCSDGVWEFIDSESAVQEVAKFPVNDGVSAAEHLSARAWECWMREMDGQVVDDITAVLVHLDTT